MTVETKVTPEEFLREVGDVHPITQVFTETSLKYSDPSTYRVYGSLESGALVGGDLNDKGSLVLRVDPAYIELELHMFSAAYLHNNFLNDGYRGSGRIYPVTYDLLTRDALKGEPYTHNDRVGFGHGTYGTDTWMDKSLEWIFEVMADHMKRKNAILHPSS
jgi:hypothetical protein